MRNLTVVLAAVTVMAGCGGGKSTPRSSSSTTSTTTSDPESFKLPVADACDEYFVILKDLTLNYSEMSARLGFLANKTAEPGLVAALNSMADQYTEADLARQYGTGDEDLMISTGPVAAYC